MWRAWSDIERYGEDEGAWIDIDQVIKRLDSASGLSFDQEKLSKWCEENHVPINQLGMIDEYELTEKLLQAAYQELRALTIN